MMGEFFTDRGQWPSRIEEEANASRPLSPGEAARVNRTIRARGRDLPDPTVPRINVISGAGVEQEVVVEADKAAVKDISERTNRYVEEPGQWSGEETK